MVKFDQNAPLLKNLFLFVDSFLPAEQFKQASQHHQCQHKSYDLSVDPSAGAAVQSDSKTHDRHQQGVDGDNAFDRSRKIQIVKSYRKENHKNKPY